MMLRRTKAQVAKQLSLPPCVHEDRGIIMGDKQRNLYDQLAGDFRSTMKQLREQRVNPAHQFGVYARAANPSTAMRILTSLRQACCHVGIVKLDRKEKARTKASLREAVSELVLQVSSCPACHLNACKTLCLYGALPTSYHLKAKGMPTSDQSGKPWSM